MWKSRLSANACKWFFDSTIGTLQLFDEPFILTAGGPNNATTTITLYLYETGFKYFEFGYASAIKLLKKCTVFLKGISYLGGKQ